MAVRENFSSGRRKRGAFVLNRLWKFLKWQKTFIDVLPFLVPITALGFTRQPRRFSLVFTEFMCIWYFGSFEILIEGELPRGDLE